MKLGIPDIDKQIHQATAPFLARLDNMQTVLEAILEELRERKYTPSGMDEFAEETTWNPEDRP